MAMLLIRATKLCRKSIRKEGCLRCTRGWLRPKLGFWELKTIQKSRIHKMLFRYPDWSFDMLSPVRQKKGNIGIGGIGQDTRECLVHFCDKDCPVTPECPRFEEKKNLDYWQCPKKILACDVATSPGDFANLSIHFCCLKSTPHESFLHPRTHPKNAPWPVEIPSVQANFMQWNSICMNLPT